MIEKLEERVFDGLKSTLKNMSLQYTRFNSNGLQSLQSFKKLECLKLGFNEISVLHWSDLYAISTSLTHVDLQANQIASIAVDENPNDNQVLQGLVELDLSNNKLCTFDKALFNRMKSLKSLSLTQNPLHCDCHLLDLYEWTRRTYDKDLVQFVQWKCENMANKRLVSLNPNDFKCDTVSKCHKQPTTNTTQSSVQQQQQSTPMLSMATSTPTINSQTKSTINDFYITSYDNNLYVKWHYDGGSTSIDGFRIYIAEDSRDSPNESKTYTISDIKQRNFLVRNLNFNKKYVICLSVADGGFNKYCKSYVIISSGKYVPNETTQKQPLANPQQPPQQTINSILFTIIISVLITFLVFFIFFVYIFMYKCSNSASTKSSLSTNTSMVSSTLSSLKNTNGTSPHTTTTDIYNTLHHQQSPVHVKALESIGEQHVYCEIPSYYFYPHHQLFNSHKNNSNFNGALLVINPSTTSSSSLIAPQNQFTVSSTSII